MTMQQVKNINKTDKHIHSHKNRYLEVISRFTRFKEFNGEKKTATKTSNMFKIVPRIGTCDAGFSSSKFRSSCLPFVDLTNVNNMAFYISGPKLLFETTEISTHPNSTQQESNYIYLYTTKFGTSIKIRVNRVRDNESQLYL
jgi:hypothetical protein